MAIDRLLRWQHITTFYGFHTLFNVIPLTTVTTDAIAESKRPATSYLEYLKCFNLDFTHTLRYIISFETTDIKTNTKLILISHFSSANHNTAFIIFDLCSSTSLLRPHLFCFERCLGKMVTDMVCLPVFPRPAFLNLFSGLSQGLH